MGDSKRISPEEASETVIPRRCGASCEVWSRIVGYYRPLSDWNRGKRHEFTLRKTVKITGETVDRIPAAKKMTDAAAE